MCFGGMALFPSKHATLINNCYPSQPGDFIPKSNELSYLEFYANSRPEKLTKVGVFLEKKVISDLWKKRNEHVHVTLAIWKSLITTNPTQINLFAEPFLKSIYHIISSNDLSLLPVTTETLNTFYQVKGKQVINSDPEIADYNLRILNYYSDYTTSDNQDSASKLTQRYYGIWGLLGISQSEESLSSDSHTYLERIVPSILRNATKPILEVDQLSEIMIVPEDLKAPTSIAPDAINRLACFGLYQLLSGGSVIHVKTVMELLLKFLDDNNVWGHEKYVTDLLLLTSNSVQSQFGYIPVATVLKYFEMNHPQNGSGDSRQVENLNNSSHVLKIKCLITALASLLSNRKSFVGISILEILNTLIIQLLIQEKVIHDIENQTGSSEKCSAKDLRDLQTRTISTISSLGTHIYYSDQIIDILSFLTNKLKINSSVPHTNDNEIDHNRIVILKTMAEIIRQFHTQYPQLNPPPKCNLSLSILNPLFTLFTTNDSLTKFHLKEFLVELTNNLSFYSRMGTIHDIEFVNSLNQSVYQYIRDIKPSNWIDLVIIFQILEVMYPAFGDQGLFSVIPLLFKFQDMNPDIEDVVLYKHTLIHNLVNLHFENLGTKLNNHELKEYCQSVEKLKQSNHQWVPNLFELMTDPNLDQKWDLPLEQAIGFEGDHLEKGSDLDFIRCKHPLDRQKIISILLNDPSLMPLITKDVSLKLQQEYSPEKAQLEFQQSKYRIRSSTTFRTKSKPNSPKSPAGVAHINIEPVKILKVESLKEALNPLYVTEGSSDMDSDSDIQAASLYNTRRSPRENSRADVNSLLKTINGSQTTGRRSNISLVNGPNYP